MKKFFTGAGRFFAGAFVVISAIVTVSEFLGLIDRLQGPLAQCVRDPLVQRGASGVLFLTACGLGFHYRQRYQRQKSQIPTTITIFLPLSNGGPNVCKDGESQLRGVATFLAQECNLTGQFHLAIFDSFPARPSGKRLSEAQDLEMRRQHLKGILVRQYESGCRYFFCTMSQVFVELVPLFQALSDSSPVDDRPTLLATVTAKILEARFLADKSIFRYYPRATEEGASLADWIKAHGINDPVIVPMKSAFGEDIEKTVNLHLRDTNPARSIPAVRDELSSTDIKRQIEEQLARTTPGHKRCLVLILYGEALLKTIRALNEIEQPLIIVSASTLSVAISSGLVLSKRHSWSVCVPKGHRLEDDVVTHYVSTSIKYYATCIRKMKGKSESSFRDEFAAQLTSGNAHLLADQDIMIDTEIRSVPC